RHGVPVLDVAQRGEGGHPPPGFAAGQPGGHAVVGGKPREGHDRTVLEPDDDFGVFAGKEVGAGRPALNAQARKAALDDRPACEVEERRGHERDVHGLDLEKQGQDQKGKDEQPPEVQDRHPVPSREAPDRRRSLMQTDARNAQAGSENQIVVPCPSWLSMPSFPLCARRLNLFIASPPVFLMCVGVWTGGRRLDVRTSAPHPAYECNRYPAARSPASSWSPAPAGPKTDAVAHGALKGLKEAGIKCRRRCRSQDSTTTASQGTSTPRSPRSRFL